MFELAAVGSNFSFNPTLKKNKFKFDLTIESNKFLDAVDAWLGKEAKRILKNGLSLNLGDIALQIERDDEGDVMLTKNFKIKELNDGSISGTFRLKRNTNSIDQQVGDDDSYRLWDDDNEINTYSEYIQYDDSISSPIDLQMNFIGAKETRLTVFNHTDSTLQLIPLKPSDSGYDWSAYKMDFPEYSGSGMAEKFEKIMMRSQTNVGSTGDNSDLVQFAIDKGQGIIETLSSDFRELGPYKPKKMRKKITGMAQDMVVNFLEDTITGLLDEKEVKKEPKGDPITLAPRQNHRFIGSESNANIQSNVNDVEFIVIAIDQYKNYSTLDNQFAFAYLGKWAFDNPHIGSAKAKIARPGINNELATYYDSVDDGINKDGKKLNHFIFPGIDFTTRFFGNQDEGGKTYKTWDLLFDGSIL